MKNSTIIKTTAITTCVASAAVSHFVYHNPAGTGVGIAMGVLDLFNDYSEFDKLNNVEMVTACLTDAAITVGAVSVANLIYTPTEVSLEDTMWY